MEWYACGLMNTQIRLSKRGAVLLGTSVLSGIVLYMCAAGQVTGVLSSGHVLVSPVDATSSYAATPIARGVILGEAGQFVAESYDGMALVLNVEDGNTHHERTIRMSPNAVVYPREYICTSVCPSFVLRGYVGWGEYSSLLHKQECRPPLASGREKYCERMRAGRVFDFFGEELPSLSGDMHLTITRLVEVAK
jgi:hypothetical protein